MLFACEEKSDESVNNASGPPIDSIKLVYKQIVEAIEHVDADRLITFFSRSPDLRFVNQDAVIISDYDSLHNTFRNSYSGLVGMVTEMDPPSIRLISPDDAVAIVSGEFTATRKDNTTLGGPLAWTLIFTRDSGQWKLINVHQSIKWR